MQATRIGNITITNPRRMAGTYQSAYEVTTESGQMGLVLYVYEYDGRDVVEELVFVEPNIADEVKNMIDDESPSCSGMFSFPEKSEENQNQEKISIAMEKATSLVYGTDEDGAVDGLGSDSGHEDDDEN